MSAEELDRRRAPKLIVRPKEPERGTGRREMKVTQDILQSGEYSSWSIPLKLPTRIPPLVAGPERE